MVIYTYNSNTGQVKPGRTEVQNYPCLHEFQAILGYMRVCLKKKKKKVVRAGKVAQWLRAFAALVEDPGLVPSTHMTSYNCLKLQFQGISCPLFTLEHQYKCDAHTYLQTKLTHIKAKVSTNWVGCYTPIISALGETEAEGS